MKITREIAENIILDWNKNNISREEKAEFVKKYREKYKLSQREFAKRFGVPHTTTYYWENPEKMNANYKDEEKNLTKFLKTLENITNPDISLLKQINKIEIEINRLKDIISRKKIND